jgi:hypothetical protein
MARATRSGFIRKGFVRGSVRIGLPFGKNPSVTTSPGLTTVTMTPRGLSSW